MICVIADFFFLMIRQPPRFPLFPDTTLSGPPMTTSRSRGSVSRARASASTTTTGSNQFHSPPVHSSTMLRSEEHTSELQSRQYLVCRLLLEKKNIRKTKRNIIHYNNILTLKF